MQKLQKKILEIRKIFESQLIIGKLNTNLTK